MKAGSVRRRCRCRDENGNDLGSKCPKLSQRSHGSWQLRQELVPTAEDKRRIFRRQGYETQTKAQADLDKVRTLLALGTADGDAEAISAMLDALGTDEEIPDAEAVARKLRAGQDLGTSGTLGDWMDTWLANQTHLRRSSWKRYECDIRNHIKPHIGYVRRDRVNVGHVRELINRIEDTNDEICATNTDRNALRLRIADASTRAEKNALRQQLSELPPYRRVTSKSSQVRVLACVRKALNDLIAEQGATYNAAKFVKVSARRPKPLVWTDERVSEWRHTGQRPGPVMVWTPQQAGLFLDYVAEHASVTLQGLFHVAVFRGPRRGELCGLSWTETNVDGRNTLEITKQVLELEYNNLEEGAPKSEAGERIVPLDAEGVRLIRAVRHWQRIRKLELGGAWVESGRVFTGDDGSQLRPSWVGDQFERLYKAADLPPIRLHDVRHVAATLMLTAGIDMKVVQETLGHSALAVTSDIYTSVLPELARAAAEAVTSVVPRGTRRALAETLGHPSGTQEINMDQAARGDEALETPKPQVDRGLSAV